MAVEISMPSDEEWDAALLEATKESVDAALSVADDVGVMIRERAILDAEDVDGNEMAWKKPRPKKNPTNFPHVPLIQSDDPDLMNPERWSVERTGEYEATVTYNPPEHFWIMMTKAPENGGRIWLTQDKMNPNAEKAIGDEMERRGNG